jgi:hypothetical protein
MFGTEKQQTLSSYPPILQSINPANLPAETAVQAGLNSAIFLFARKHHLLLFKIHYLCNS